VYAVKNAVLTRSVMGWKVNLPDGTEVYMPQISGGISVLRHPRILRYKPLFGGVRTYEGPLDAQGRANGTGVYHFIYGQTLSGTWVHGRMSGEMTERFASGTTIRVKVSPPAALLEGAATITFANGDRASALLHDDSLNGAGSYVYAATGYRIDGTFDEGRLRGPATLTTPDGDRYVGRMVNGTVQ
jgi:hypothetical protein